LNRQKDWGSSLPPAFSTGQTSCAFSAFLGKGSLSRGTMAATDTLCIGRCGHGGHKERKSKKFKELHSTKPDKEYDRVWVG